MTFAKTTATKLRTCTAMGDMVSTVYMVTATENHEYMNEFVDI